MNDKKTKKTTFLLLLVVIILLSAMMIPFIYIFHDYPLSNKIQDWGAFGSYFSGVLTAITLGFMIFFNFRQNKSLQIQINEQREKESLARFENIFFNLLEQHNVKINSLPKDFNIYPHPPTDIIIYFKTINTLLEHINSSIPSGINAHIYYDIIKGFIDNKLLVALHKYIFDDYFANKSLDKLRENTLKSNLFQHMSLIDYFNIPVYHDQIDETNDEIIKHLQDIEQFINLFSDYFKKHSSLLPDNHRLYIFYNLTPVTGYFNIIYPGIIEQQYYPHNTKGILSNFALIKEKINFYPSPNLDIIIDVYYDVYVLLLQLFSSTVHAFSQSEDYNNEYNACISQTLYNLAGLYPNIKHYQKNFPRQAISVQKITQ